MQENALPPVEQNLAHSLNRGLAQAEAIRRNLIALSSNHIVNVEWRQIVEVPAPLAAKLTLETKTH